MSAHRSLRKDAPDLRLVGIVAACWASVWWAVGAPQHLWWGVGVTAAGTVVAWLRRWWLLAVGGALVAVCLIACAVRVASVTASPLVEAAARGQMVTTDITTTSDPRRLGEPGRERVQMPGRTVWWEARGSRWQEARPVVVRASGEHLDQLAAVPAGATVRVRGPVRAAEPGRPEVAIMQVRSLEVVRHPPWWMRQVNRVRAGLVDAMRWSTPEQAGLTPSLVVGDTSRLLPETHEAFQKTGLTHLTAVSGTNLTLLLGTLLALARAVGVRGRWLHAVAVGGVALFVVICRAEPSVIRAAAMGVVGLAAMGVAADRRRGLRNLSTAVVALVLLDPWLARSWGFALSVTASAGLLWWGPPWRRVLATWLPAWAAEAIAISWAAQLATQPLVTALSGTVSTSGLLANVLAGPFVGPTTILGMIAAVVALVAPSAAAVAGWLAGWCLQPVIVISHLGGGLPASVWHWPATPLPMAILVVACLAFAQLTPQVFARRWLSLAMAVALVLAMWRQPPPVGWPGNWQVAFCAVGQGDATVLNAGAGAAVLVDLGPEAAPVASCLSSLGVERVVMVVATHYHADHVGGSDVLARARGGLLLTNPHRQPALAPLVLERSAGRHEMRVAEAAVGQRFTVGRVRLEVCHVGVVPGSDVGAGESGAENDSSIVVFAEVNGLRVLLTGDIEPAAQRHMLRHGRVPPVHVLKMPHHGSSRQEERFWRATGATVAVASAGRRNTHGHPSRKALTLGSRLGMAVVRTDGDESITVWHGQGRVQMRRAVVTVP